VSASIYAAKGRLVQVQHPFFERSMRLFNVLKNHQTKELGVVTQTIEREGNSVLEKAVMNELSRSGNKILASVLLDLCSDRFDELLSLLLKEKVEHTKFPDVVSMYTELLGRASLVTPTTARAAVYDHIAPRRFKRLMTEIWTHQLLSDRSQLTRLRTHRPSNADQLILAEAAYLYERYNSEEKTELFLASMDIAFSPIMRRDHSILSDIVTNEIAKRFGVICNWPEEVANFLRGVYG
jgi:hypothetical protein